MICGVCGQYINTADSYEIKSVYSVGFKFVCTVCCKIADGFVNYCGHKSEQDRQRLHHFLISGVLPMRDYYTLVNAGYFN